MACAGIEPYVFPYANKLGKRLPPVQYEPFSAVVGFLDNLEGGFSLIAKLLYFSIEGRSRRSVVADRPRCKLCSSLLFFRCWYVATPRNADV